MPDTTLFLQAFTPVLEVMLALFVVALIGFLGVRKGLVDDGLVTGMTRLLVDIVAPAALLTGMMAGLNAETLARSGVTMLVMTVWCLLGIGLGWILTLLWRGREAAGSLTDRTLISLCGFQNGIYLPLPLCLALVPADHRPEVAVYVGGAVISMVALQWTIGLFLLRGDSAIAEARSGARTALRNAFTPPLIAILVGGVLAAIPPVAAAARGESDAMLLRVPFQALQILGSALAPVAMLLLGMLIGRCRLRASLSPRAILLPTLTRLFVSPVLMIVALASPFLGWVPGILAMVLIVQAAAPPATNLSVMARRYGGDWELVSSVLLVTYLGALLTMPLFTAIVMTWKPL